MERTVAYSSSPSFENIGLEGGLDQRICRLTQIWNTHFYRFLMWCNDTITTQHSLSRNKL